MKPESWPHHLVDTYPCWTFWRLPVGRTRLGSREETLLLSLTSYLISWSLSLFSLCLFIFVICWIHVFVFLRHLSFTSCFSLRFFLIWYVAAIPCPQPPHLLLASCRPGDHIGFALVLVGRDVVLTQVLVWCLLPRDRGRVPWPPLFSFSLSCLLLAFLEIYDFLEHVFITHRELECPLWAWFELLSSGWEKFWWSQHCCCFQSCPTTSDELMSVCKAGLVLFV